MILDNFLEWIRPGARSICRESAGVEAAHSRGVKKGSTRRPEELPRAASNPLCGAGVEETARFFRQARQARWILSGNRETCEAGLYLPASAHLVGRRGLDASSCSIRARVLEAAARAAVARGLDELILSAGGTGRECLDRLLFPPTGHRVAVDRDLSASSFSDAGLLSEEDTPGRVPRRPVRRPLQRLHRRGLVAAPAFCDNPPVPAAVTGPLNGPGRGHR